ncbi:MAG: ribosome silencing factor [Scytolyngbya sp. HA4215-MV1]|jgi:ribosome-associated protein|nr:ribosome silencing factor [Scytolyngbya sp. HA4215-MV1]
MTEPSQTTSFPLPVLPNARQSGAVQPNLTSDTDSGLQLALTAARASDDRKGSEITLLKVSQVSYLADYFVIVTGFSKAQVRAIARAVEEKVEELCHRSPIRVEGQGEGSWILQDYGDVIVHILMPQEREFYNLEAFWGHAERIDFLVDT